MKEAHQVHESARRGADHDGQDGLSEKLTNRLRRLEFRARHGSLEWKKAWCESPGRRLYREEV